MRYYYPPELNPLIRVEGSIYSWSIVKFLVIFGTFLLTAILAGSVFVTYQVASSYLNQAYSRNAQIRALAQAHEVNELLVAARRELEFLSRSLLTPEAIARHLAAKSPKERERYREIAYQGTTAEDRFVLLNIGAEVVSLPLDQALAAKFGVFSGRDQLAGKAEGHVSISEPLEVIYPSVPGQGGANSVAMHVLRLSTPVTGPERESRGQLTLSVDLTSLRDTISLHTSEQSPLYMFPQENEHKKSFFFDAAGWLLFQSESPEQRRAELSVDQLRIGLQGDVGRPGFNTAFRPGSIHDLFWAMVSDIQGGKSGQLLVSKPFFAPSGSDRTLYLSYVPIVFDENAESRRIVGGIGCIDTSFMYMASTYRVGGTLAVCFVLGMVLVFIALYYLGRRICRPLDLLAEAVDVRVAGDDPSPLALSPLFAEINQFQQSINILLLQLQIARSDTILREGIYEDDRLRQTLNLDKEIANSPDLDPQLLAMPLYGIVGGSQAVGHLRQQIQKASRVMADVLIIGETGTGKELTAEAIHSVSHRSKGPFLSINCGALDEHLLMDALFGHVKGAFSDAHTDRQGAFLAASGGTLHLDEIGNASPKVQQALLRALSVRRIRPLGLDRDIAFDARIIAATNEDLLQLAISGAFREDLYYRLAVITINTPPLRQRREDIPVLVRHCLQEQAILSGKRVVGISRGALEKLMAYDWPGNIRELKNCMTRSLAFVEGDILLAEHVLFDDRTAGVPSDGKASVRRARVAGGEPAEGQAAEQVPLEGDKEEQEAGKAGLIPPGLNHRQRRAWPVIVGNGGISRGQYQEAVGDAISVRTAQYDLHDLTAKGLLRKSGRGPSSRYLLERQAEA